jgi:hypothetical protein
MPASETTTMPKIVWLFMEGWGWIRLPRKGEQQVRER